jgi:23S rRNA pseudouridine1911/1915/1917 synthase
MQRSDKNVIEPLYEDNHLLAINKPAGWLSQGDKTNDTTILDEAKSYIKDKYHKPGAVFLGLCHRLDRPVSGVLLLARTSKALERINLMFAKGEISKTYWAISTRMPKHQNGLVTQWLKKDAERNMVTASSEEIAGGKKAETHFRVLNQAESYTLTELKPTTGRSHQLRVAMKSLKASIAGDVKYGGVLLDPKSIALHCRSLQFVHPVTKESILITAPTPDEIPWVLF